MSALSDPAGDFRPLTPGDSTDITGCRSVYISASGNFVFRTLKAPSTTQTLAVSAGQEFNIRLVRLMAATTATVWGYF